MRAFFIVTILFIASFSGCFGEDGAEETDPSLSVEDISTALRGQFLSIEVDSNVDWTANRSAGLFFVDADGVFKDAQEMTFPASQTTLEILVLDTERTDIELTITAGNEVWNATMMLEDSSEMMFLDGRRAFDTIDMLTTDYNNRWCASTTTHDGNTGQSYENAAEAMKTEWETYGFDFVEVTRYEDDPDQLNVVGYKYGNVYPDQYIVLGGHFDVGYAFTPPGGGTTEGANDDTSGSTVSMEVAQAIASREWDHTVVAALWACEEEGLLGSAAFVNHLPEGKAVKAYMNFDMVSLNYPIIPPPGYGPYDLSIATAGANDENLATMLEWVRLVVEDEMNFHDVAANDIYWEAAESCASDHCSFFTQGYATFNFFSAGGDASFWQEWHSPTDNLDFMVAKAGGEDQLGDGFNTLVWTAFSLFIHIDNTDDSFQGRWMTED
ncbi:MAG: M28 family peptidase [Euryarchaeota archaeon]|jgi:hypothetical protein|nr:M28 family peptidase [Euryarchaeota archaeon]MBT4982826.1 M28 family peptidase [Euryarchaeota archaeon]MBT5184504.1 M28 family peptidase [Euryarchaeota archaeon]